MGIPTYDQLLGANIGRPEIQNFVGALAGKKAPKGIFITTSKLNDVAHQKAKEAGKEPIQTIEHEEILNLFADHGIGIRQETIRYHQIDESQYDFLRTAKKA